MVKTKLQIIQYLKNHGMTPQIYFNKYPEIDKKPDNKEDYKRVEINTHTGDINRKTLLLTFQYSRIVQPRHH